MKRIFNTRVIATLIVALVAAVLIAVSLALSSGRNAGQNLTETLLQPFRTGAAAFTREAERLYNYIYRYEALEAENRLLKEQITQMEQENEQAAQFARENERLRELLNLQEDYPEYRFVPAYIIGWNNSDYRSSFTIGKGTAAGVEIGMCAVTEYKQIVGLITAVGANWATVTTVLDSNLQISAQVSGAGYTGVAQGTLQTGQAGDIRLDYLSADAVLKSGDLVVTSGSGYYPKGLTLGRIASFGLSEGGTSRFAEVSAAADFTQLEQVFLITDYIVE